MSDGSTINLRAELEGDVEAAEDDLRRAKDKLEAFEAAEAERQLATRRFKALFVRDWAEGWSSNALRDIERKTLQ